MERSRRKDQSTARGTQGRHFKQQAPDDDAARERSFRERPAALRSMAQEAMEEHRRGETRPLDELIR
jgi:hypothetical protein